MSAEETVNVNPDGSTTFEGGEESTMPPVEDQGEEGIFEEVVKVTDPAIYLLLLVVVFGVLYFIYYRSQRGNEDDFFADLDGEKVSNTVMMWPKSSLPLVQTNELILLSLSLNLISVQSKVAR
jgi:hypothetical protein